MAARPERSGYRELARTRQKPRTEASGEFGVGNVYDLFSRFDFAADVSTANTADVKVQQRTSFSFNDPAGFKLRIHVEVHPLDPSRDERAAGLRLSLDEPPLVGRRARP